MRHQAVAEAVDRPDVGTVDRGKRLVKLSFPLLRECLLREFLEQDLSKAELQFSRRPARKRNGCETSNWNGFPIAAVRRHQVDEPSDEGGCLACSRTCIDDDVAIPL